MVVLVAGLKKDKRQEETDPDDDVISAEEGKAYSVDCAAVAVMDPAASGFEDKRTPTIQQQRLGNALTAFVHVTEKRLPVTERISWAIIVKWIAAEMLLINTGCTI